MPRTKLIFEILWYSGGSDHAPNYVIGRTRIARYDLSDACHTAARLFDPANVPARRRLTDDQRSTIQLAHGFYVRRAQNPEEAITDVR